MSLRWRIALALGVRGILNVQMIASGARVVVIEANPRASRTVPIVAKATGLDVVAAAVDDAQAVVGVVGRGAQSREVLDRCGHAGRLEPAHHRRAVPGDRS